MCLLNSVEGDCCCCSVAKSCLTFCSPMNCSTPGFSVPHHLELAQIHILCIGDAIQPAHLLPPSSSPAFNLSQHHNLFQRVGSSHQVWEYGSFSWVWKLPEYGSFSFSISLSKEYSGLISFRIDWLISLLSKGLSRVFSSITIWKHQTIPGRGNGSPLQYSCYENPMNMNIIATDRK